MKIRFLKFNVRKVLPITFHYAKFQKNPYNKSRVLKMCQFFRRKWSICPKLDFFFFWKTINISSMHLLNPFIVQNFKKILRVDQELWGCTIFCPKMACLLEKIFFSRKPITKPCCTDSCLSTYKKSESDVNPLMRYWRLSNAGILLAKSILGHKLRTRFFPHMWFLQSVKGSSVFSFYTIRKIFWIEFPKKSKNK